jgi:hypothetical protein
LPTGTQLDPTPSRLQRLTAPQTYSLAKRGRESVSSSRSEEVDARRASAGQTEEFLADGHPAQPNALPFAAPDGAANVLPREARERERLLLTQ